MLNQNQVLTGIIKTFMFLASYHTFYPNVELVSINKEEGSILWSLNIREIGPQESHNQVAWAEEMERSNFEFSWE